MSTASRGNAAERFVAHEREEQGFVVASRRHVGGAGDLLCIHPDGRVQLIEVKCCKEVWQQFRRADRKEMRAVYLPRNAQKLLVNKRGKNLEWFEESEWPS